ncbi:Hemolysin, plasmid [Roseovarius aestuarii]|uniref:Hemolysin, plasmid n=1 Tax=Roseovarius aestuarii TaxID=475083 RepID=A0A1X7BYV1_9RHOB|nr:Hemolysin, plasmid [Roseovarius aestuarii]
MSPAAGSSITISYEISNVGTGSAIDTTAGIYLSTDNIINTGDILLATNLSTTSNAAGSIDVENQTITLPSSLIPGTTYYIGVIADYDDQQTGELSESNNGSAAIAITIPSVPPPVLGPDLIASNLSLGSTSWDDGDMISVSWDIENIGGTSASASASSLYISTNTTISTGDVLLATDTSTGTMAPGFVNSEGPASGNFTFDIASLGLSPGAYYVGVLADVNNAIAEDDESNNVSNLVQVTVNSPPSPPPPQPPTIKKLSANDDKFVRDTSTKDFEVYGRAGNDFIKTGSGDDVLKGNSGKDRLVAGAGDDSLYGGSRADKLSGGADNDVLNGGKGKDKLVAGSGDDLLIGGGAADHFVFRPNFDSVTVADFSGNDVIDLRAMNFSSVNDALSAASMSGSDAVFDFGGGDVLVLQNVDFTTLSGSDFLI